MKKGEQVNGRTRTKRSGAESGKPSAEVADGCSVKSLTTQHRRQDSPQHRPGQWRDFPAKTRQRKRKQSRPLPEAAEYVLPVVQVRWSGAETDTSLTERLRVHVLPVFLSSSHLGGVLLCRLLALRDISLQCSRALRWTFWVVATWSWPVAVRVHAPFRLSAPREAPSQALHDADV